SCVAEHAKNFSIEAELVDSPRKRIRAEQHLMRRRGNANGPRRTWRSRTRGMIGFVANRGPCIWRDGDVDNDLAQEFTISVKYLNSMISAVCDINIVLRVNSEAVRGVELTGFVPRFTPRLQPIAVFI